MHSITLNIFEIFCRYLEYIYVRSRRRIAYKTGCLPIAILFELSPLNEIYRGTIVSSIIVNILYLLTLTLSIISSNIYTRLTVCNCLSGTLRSGDLPSLLMDIFLCFY